MSSQKNWDSMKNPGNAWEIPGNMVNQGKHLKSWEIPGYFSSFYYNSVGQGLAKGVRRRTND